MNDEIAERIARALERMRPWITGIYAALVALVVLYYLNSIGWME